MWNSAEEQVFTWLLIGLFMLAWFHLFLRIFDFAKLYWYVIRDYDYDPTEMALRANALRWHIMAWTIIVFFMTWIVRNFL